MSDLIPETPSIETECRILLDGAKSLVRAIRNRERHPDGMNYVDMEADSLETSIVNLFGESHRGPMAPVATNHTRRTPFIRSRRQPSRFRHAATVAA